MTITDDLHTIRTTINASGDGAAVGALIRLGAFIEATHREVPTSQLGARATDPTTSTRAASNGVPRTGSQRHRLLAAYQSDDLTDEEAAMRSSVFDIPGACWWKRCSELRADHYIEVSLYVGTSNQVTRESALTGEERIVCQLTDKGRALLAGSTQKGTP